MLDSRRSLERLFTAPWLLAETANVDASFLFVPECENTGDRGEPVFYVSEFRRRFRAPGPALQMYQLFRKTVKPAVPLLECALIDQQQYSECVRRLQSAIVAKLAEMGDKNAWPGGYMFHGTSFVAATEILRLGTIEATPCKVNGRWWNMAWGANWLETALGYPSVTHWRCGWDAQPLQGVGMDGQRLVSSFDVQIAFIFRRPEQTGCLLYTSDAADE